VFCGLRWRYTDPGMSFSIFFFSISDENAKKLAHPVVYVYINGIE